MKVYRCDRCGIHYTDREKNHTIEVFEVVDGKRQLKSSLYISSDMNPIPRDWLDLCPDCIISLIAWINSGGAPYGRKFRYKYTDEDFALDKISKEIEEIKEVKEDGNN